MLHGNRRPDRSKQVCRDTSDRAMASAGASGHSTMTPSCNRLLQRKWDEKRFRTHKERLRTMKASVNNQAPRNFVHIRQNPRKHQIEDDRLAEIDRHNRELLTRMHHIMQTTGRVDHRNLEWKPKKSLGYLRRQEEMDRIQRENQSMLRRLQTVRPQYNTRKWESDFKVHQSHTKRLAIFPPIESPPKTKLPARPEGSKVEPLPPIVDSTRPETQPSEIQEEIDVED